MAYITRRGGGFKPLGTMQISANGTYNVAGYEKAEVDINIPDPPEIYTGSYSVKRNQTLPTANKLATSDFGIYPIREFEYPEDYHSTDYLLKYTGTTGNYDHFFINNGVYEMRDGQPICLFVDSEAVEGFMFEIIASFPVQVTLYDPFYTLESKYDGIRYSIRTYLPKTIEFTVNFAGGSLSYLAIDSREGIEVVQEEILDGDIISNDTFNYLLITDTAQPQPMMMGAMQTTENEAYIVRHGVPFKPSGSLTVTENGIYDVYDLVELVVDTYTLPDAYSGSYTVTQQGTIKTASKIMLQDLKIEIPLGVALFGGVTEVELPELMYETVQLDFGVVKYTGMSNYGGMPHPYINGGYYVWDDQAQAARCIYIDPSTQDPTGYSLVEVYDEDNPITIVDPSNPHTQELVIPAGYRFISLMSWAFPIEFNGDYSGIGLDPTGEAYSEQATAATSINLLGLAYVAIKKE